MTQPACPPPQETSLQAQFSIVMDALFMELRSGHSQTTPGLKHALENGTLSASQLIAIICTILPPDREYERLDEIRWSRNESDSWNFWRAANRDEYIPHARKMLFELNGNRDFEITDCRLNNIADAMANAKCLKGSVLDGNRPTQSESGIVVATERIPLYEYDPLMAAYRTLVAFGLLGLLTLSEPRDLWHEAGLYYYMDNLMLELRDTTVRCRFPEPAAATNDRITMNSQIGAILQLHEWCADKAASHGRQFTRDSNQALLTFWSKLSVETFSGILIRAKPPGSIEVPPSVLATLYERMKSGGGDESEAIRLLLNLNEHIMNQRTRQPTSDEYSTHGVKTLGDLMQPPHNGSINEMMVPRGSYRYKDRNEPVAAAVERILSDHEQMLVGVIHFLYQKLEVDRHWYWVSDNNRIHDYFRVKGVSDAQLEEKIKCVSNLLRFLGDWLLITNLMPKETRKKWVYVVRGILKYKNDEVSLRGDLPAQFRQLADQLEERERESAKASGPWGNFFFGRRSSGRGSRGRLHYGNIRPDERGCML